MQKLMICHQVLGALFPLELLMEGYHSRVMSITSFA